MSAAFERELLEWYAKNHRDLEFRQTKDPYRIWISEVMAQQTRIETMRPYFENFIKTYPTLQDLAHADDDTLHKAWQGLGYYSRARNLKKTAVICEKSGLPDAKTELLKLPGIGPYTAGAIASIAFGEKVSAVDGNVLRVYSRIYDVHEDVLSTQGRKTITALVDADLSDEIGDWNQALMELGALICTPVPKCDKCPISAYCAADDPASLPVKKKSRPKRVEKKKLVVYSDGSGIKLVKRSEGLLSGLYGFEETDTYPADSIDLGEYSHTFSHVVWQMEARLVINKNIDCVSFDTIRESYSIPSAYMPFLERAEKVLRNLNTDSFQTLPMV